MPIDTLKRHKCALIENHARPDDLRGLTQVLTTLGPLALLWCAALWCSHVSLWLTLLPMAAMMLFLVRVFGLMHECGHCCLFRNQRLNQAFGFVLGVVAGMPQYVWSQHHNYHHLHNGNWDRYRGPYTTLSVDEYAALSRWAQRFYRGKCSLQAAPLAGFLYLVYNPRRTWIKGSFDLIAHIIRGKLAQPRTPLREHAASFKPRYWKTPREYRHMLWNNLVLLGLWGLMCWAVGPARFFAIYLLTLSVAGGIGIVLFTVQHNFEHSWAVSDGHWDRDTGAIQGTSFLVLPDLLNWFTVDIGYHHVHHLSANIPNYRLAACHREYAHLFEGVTRVKLCAVPDSLKCILWDKQAQRIISISEYNQRVAAPAPAAAIA